MYNQCAADGNIFIFIPILIYFAIKMRAKMTEAFTEARVKIGEVNANLENSISGIRVSKAFTNAEYEEEKFQAGNNAFKRAREKHIKQMAQFHSGTGLLVDLLRS